MGTVWFGAIASHQGCGKSCGQDWELPTCAKERVRPEQALTWGQEVTWGQQRAGPDLQPWLGTV